MQTLDEIRTAFEQGAEVSSTISSLSNLLSEGSLTEKQQVELLLFRAQLHWRMEERSGAINDYNAALRIDPECAEARQALTHIYDILNFYDKDRYNP
jgi:lipoprotein NlpI